ncbi:MAG: hypothetical protein M9899_07210 [Bdellovibrionaceae bacterium]|nr:hypothetical protein [Pseudobdellovibrionaceae bacterium]
MKLLILFFLICQISVSIHAKQCVQFLSSTPQTLLFRSNNESFNSYFTGKATSKFIGLAVKDSHGLTHTLLGPIIASGHRVLLEQIENKVSQQNAEVREVLWAGELHLQLTPQKVRVLEMNEVAGMNANLQNNYFPHLINSSSVRNAVEILNQNPIFEITTATKIEVFDPNRSQHILDYVSAKDFRHEMGNQFNVMMFVEMIHMGRSLGPSTKDSIVESLVNNMLTIINFTKVYKQEVGLPLPAEHQVLIDRLIRLEPEISKIKNITDLEGYVKKTPLLHEALSSAYKLFAGQLTSEALVDISKLTF